MKCILSLIIFTAAVTFGQTTHNVEIVGMSFNPQELTINVNDAVKWTNDGGLHNVLADDGSFTSGPVSSSIWEFTHTFTSTGDFGYYCEAHGSPGSGMYGVIHVQGTTGVDDVHGMSFHLKQNYPNPFNPKTFIEYSLPEAGYVTLKIFNVTGELEDVIISEFQQSGNYIIEYDAADLPSGIYFYQLAAGNNISTKQMILLK